MAAESVVADTHSLLWWIGGSDRLSGSAGEALESAAAIFVSSISFWEIGMLQAKGRIALDRPIARWVNDIVASGEVIDAPVTAPIGATASALVDLPGDPADRLIAATALSFGVPIVTKDERLRRWAAESGRIDVVW